MTVTTTAETGLRDLFSHELRWARTVRSVEPLAYPLSAIQFPLFWASLGVVLAEGALWSWIVLALAWLTRGLCGALIDRTLRLRRTLPAMLLPLRDWLSALVMAASFTGRQVAWRGQTMQLPDRISLERTPRELVPGVDAGA